MKNKYGRVKIEIEKITFDIATSFEGDDDEFGSGSDGEIDTPIIPTNISNASELFNF